MRKVIRCLACSSCARDQHVVYLPTIIADDGDDELLRCRGHPTKETTERITGLCG